MRLLGMIISRDDINKLAKKLTKISKEKPETVYLTLAEQRDRLLCDSSMSIQKSNLRRLKC